MSIGPSPSATCAGLRETSETLWQMAGTMTQAQVQDMLRASIVDKDDVDSLSECSGTGNSAPDASLAAIRARRRADATYSTLSALVAQLGAIRQERKSGADAPREGEGERG